ncbi:hypothetical protein CRENBAI_010173 [Crenichthys baileyi]|uniref:Uncharacterized protein n=1 Tax=Crenichthys baileyi TaxID=28760 RepID=A0AAV9RSG9_9TELE
MGLAGSSVCLPASQIQGLEGEKDLLLTGEEGLQPNKDQPLKPSENSTEPNHNRDPIVFGTLDHSCFYLWILGRDVLEWVGRGRNPPLGVRSKAVRVETT